MSHLTYEQRYTICIMLRSGHTQSFIATALGRDKSVISREIRRNRDGRSKLYNVDLAQRKCDQRHKEKKKCVKLTSEMQSYIVDKLSEKLSPEQIVGVSKLHGIPCISHQWIYHMIWEDKRRRGKLCKSLRSRGKPYKKRHTTRGVPGQPRNRKDIDQRPDIVDKRERFGDLEIDTVIGKGKKSALVTINDRATGMLKMGIVLQKSSELVTQQTLQLLKPWAKSLFTITADNGGEFAKHEIIAKELDIDFYFAKPYCSWQRGSNENLNGLVRQYFPKGTDFMKVSLEDVKFAENQINQRPRKRYDYLSPLEMFNQKVAFTS
jgi:transposase, IS30 family